jgi:hypothetical protein
MSKKIILESKKDKIMSELIGKYPNYGNTIKRIFDFDTPEGKYSSWIAKNLVNDFEFYEKLETANQKKIIKELREINKITRIEK